MKFLVNFFKAIWSGIKSLFSPKAKPLGQLEVTKKPTITAVSIIAVSPRPLPAGTPLSGEDVTQTFTIDLSVVNNDPDNDLILNKVEITSITANQSGAPTSSDTPVWTPSEGESVTVAAGTTFSITVFSPEPNFNADFQEGTSFTYDVDTTITYESDKTNNSDEDNVGVIVEEFDPPVPQGSL